jgi:hypothetical protein
MKIKRIILLIMVLAMSLSMLTVAYASEAEVLGEIRDATPIKAGTPNAISEERLANAIEIDMANVPYVIGDGYIEFKLDFDELLADVAPLNAGSVSGNTGVLNAFFPPGATFAESNVVIFNWLNNNSIPWEARVTEVTFTSQITAVQGMTYFPRIYWMDDFGWWIYREFRWSPTIRTNVFNNLWARTNWAVDFAAERIILGQDFGAGATMRSGTLRVFFR